MIFCNQEQATIERILAKYRLEPVSEELKKTIYNDLVAAKADGKISIPFKVVMRKADAQRDYIEVVLDTKV